MSLFENISKLITTVLRNVLQEQPYLKKSHNITFLTNNQIRDTVMQIGKRLFEVLYLENFALQLFLSL